MKKANRKPNRYILIAKPKKMTDINLITNKSGDLDFSKVILIDVPNEFEKLEEEKCDIPKKKTRKVSNPKRCEEQSRRMLAQIDTFVFHHSKEGKIVELRDYLNTSLGYQIPEDYDFAIVYRASKRNASTNNVTKFKFLEPIYGDNAYLTSWLEDLAKEEYENRIYDKDTASFKMRENLTWQRVYKECIKKDIDTKGSMVDCFSTWADTRGHVNAIEKKNQRDDFEKMWNDITQNNKFTDANFKTLSKYPLSIIMFACRRYSNNQNAWEILQRKLTSYKELRGFLLHRYHFKAKELTLLLEQELKKIYLTETQKEELHLALGEYTIYDACRYSMHSLIELKNLHMLPTSITSYGEEVLLEMNQIIEKKKENDNVHYVETVFIQDGKKQKRCVYMEHEEFEEPKLEEQEEVEEPEPCLKKRKQEENIPFFRSHL